MKKAIIIIFSLITIQLVFAKTINIIFIPISFSTKQGATNEIGKREMELDNFFPLSLYKNNIVYHILSLDGTETICRITSYGTFSFNAKNFLALCDNANYSNPIYILIINNKINKGLGGTVGKAKIPIVLITNHTDPTILHHELSHALFGLGDEYSGKLTFAVSQKEIAGFKNLSLVQNNPEWDMIKKQTGNNLIGYYEGGLERSQGIYHAYPTCLMQDGHSPLCPICLYYAIDTLNKLTDSAINYLEVYNEVRDKLYQE